MLQNDPPKHKYVSKMTLVMIVKRVIIPKDKPRVGFFKYATSKNKWAPFTCYI